VGQICEPGGGTAASKPGKDALWAEYVRRIAARDGDALARLYDESSSLLFGISLRMLGNAADAEESTADVYAQVWRSAGTWDERRGSVSAWLVMLCRSRCIDLIRSRAHRSDLEIPLPPESHGVPAVLTDVTGSTMYEREFVRRALDQLDAGQRRLLELAFFSGLTHAELSNHLNLPLGTVKTRIRSALAKMKDLMKEPAT
jgi:RNA polymerase sigma-70 factor (ECF subfamily)